MRKKEIEDILTLALHNLDRAKNTLAWGDITEVQKMQMRYQISCAQDKIRKILGEDANQTNEEDNL